jgi:hypothetical protein
VCSSDLVRWVIFADPLGYFRAEVSRPHRRHLKRW